MRWLKRTVLGLCLFSTILLIAARPALAINLEYFPHAPAYSVGYDHILTVEPDPPTFVEDAGDPDSVAKLNVWRTAPPSKGMLEASSSMATNITLAGSGSMDEFRVVSPAGGPYKIRGSVSPVPPPGFYDGENSEFTAEGVGLGPGVAVPTIWDVEIVSTGEPIGTPVRVKVGAIIQGYLDANMATHGSLPDARATWGVVAEGMTAIAGTATLIDGPGSVPFFESNLLSPVTFVKSVGDTFTLEIFYKLEVDGEVLGAISIAEVTGSEVIVQAMVIPEPGSIMLAMLGLVGAAWLNRRRGASARS